MFADKYKRWLDASCPVAQYPSVTRSNKQRGGGVFNQIKVLKKGLGIVSAEIV
jgi:hypothetical protein